MAFKVTKTLGHERGLSCAFRQWRAKSHCRLLHGYSLSISMVFAADELDERNWVIDFGGFKEIKNWLEHRFDHATLVAKDDPMMSYFASMHDDGIIRLCVVDKVGCEAFAEAIGSYIQDWLVVRCADDIRGRRLHIQSVTVAEHGSNNATWTRDKHDK